MTRLGTTVERVVERVPPCVLCILRIPGTVSIGLCRLSAQRTGHAHFKSVGSGFEPRAPHSPGDLGESAGVPVTGRTIGAGHS